MTDRAFPDSPAQCRSAVLRNPLARGPPLTGVHHDRSNSALAAPLSSRRGIRSFTKIPCLKDRGIRNTSAITEPGPRRARLLRNSRPDPLTRLSSLAAAVVRVAEVHRGGAPLFSSRAERDARELEANTAAPMIAIQAPLPIACLAASQAPYPGPLSPEAITVSPPRALLQSMFFLFGPGSRHACSLARTTPCDPLLVVSFGPYRCPPRYCAIIDAVVATRGSSSIPRCFPGN